MPGQEVPKRDVLFRQSEAGFSLDPKRNCSISPAGLLAVVLGRRLAFLQCARRFGKQELEIGTGFGAQARLQPAAGLSNRLRIGPGK